MAPTDPPANPLYLPTPLAVAAERGIPARAFQDLKQPLSSSLVTEQI